MLPYIDLYQTESGINYNTYTNINDVFVVDGDRFDLNKESDFINFMMGNFIKGTGPENYVFPPNHPINNKALRNSEIVINAIQKWVNNGRPKNMTFPSDYGIVEQGSNYIDYGSFYSIENFIGSADIDIQLSCDKKSIFVTIMNNTNLTSGDLFKHFPFSLQHGKWPVAKPRTPNINGPQPYTNISQTYYLEYKLDDNFEDYFVRSLTDPNYYRYGKPKKNDGLKKYKFN